MTKASDATAPTLDFEAFLNQERVPLLGFLRKRLPTEEDAQDVTQESLMRVMRYARSEPPRAWRPLLYRVATNAACDHARRRASRHTSEHVPLESAELICEEPSPDQTAAQDQELALLEEAILALSPKCRQVFLLHRMEGMTYIEIADRMGISPSMVQKYISKSLKMLTRLGKKGAAASRES